MIIVQLKMDHEWIEIPEPSHKKCLVCGSVLFKYQKGEMEVYMALKILSDSVDDFRARRVISCGDEVVQYVLEK